MTTTDEFLRVATMAATEAGRQLKAEFNAPLIVHSDDGRDVKLEADVRAEQAILTILRTETACPILSEEAGADSDFTSQDYHWIVDPLDGTFNFSRGLSNCAVSIGLWKGAEPVLGVVHDFNAGRTFSGIVGDGAWLDGDLITVSETAAHSRAVLMTGFPSGRDFGDASLLAFVKKAQSFKKIRLIGSAALSLAYVASGNADAYHEEDIYFWDVAAGLAILRAAGGGYQLQPGRSRWQCSVLATNGRLPDLS